MPPKKKGTAKSKKKAAARKKKLRFTKLKRISLDAYDVFCTIKIS